MAPSCGLLARGDAKLIRYCGAGIEAFVRWLKAFARQRFPPGGDMVFHTGVQRAGRGRGVKAEGESEGYGTVCGRCDISGAPK